MEHCNGLWRTQLKSQFRGKNLQDEVCHPPECGIRIKSSTLQWCYMPKLKKDEIQNQRVEEVAPLRIIPNDCVFVLTTLGPIVVDVLVPKENTLSPRSQPVSHCMITWPFWVPCAFGSTWKKRNSFLGRNNWLWSTGGNRGSFSALGAEREYVWNLVNLPWHMLKTLYPILMVNRYIKPQAEDMVTMDSGLLQWGSGSHHQVSHWC